MAQSWSKPFYNSKAWKDCRDTYIRSVGGLCESCLSKGMYRAGVEVHHKKHLTPQNITDPSVTLSFSNLQLLCHECHIAVHVTEHDRGYTIGADGRVYPPIRGTAPLP